MVSLLFRSFFASALQKKLRTHFGAVPVSEIVTAAREFPITLEIPPDVMALLVSRTGGALNLKLLGGAHDAAVPSAAARPFGRASQT